METEPAPTPNDEEKNFLGVPYDLRPPTVARLKSRWWNPADRRLLTPKTFGWGYDLNLYWIVHPMLFVGGRRKTPPS